MEDGRMNRWMHRLGYAVGWAGNTMRDLRRGTEEETKRAPVEETVIPALVTGAVGLLAARLLKPREVRWPRAVMAGVLGTLLYDATMAVDQRALGRKFDTITPLGEALTGDEETGPAIAWAAHYAAGIGLAAFYARYLYRRLPGSPVAHGVAFGLADAATLSWGGLLPLVGRLAPQLPIPSSYAGLAHAPTVTAQSLLRHAAYGAGVGWAYRPEE